MVQTPASVLASIWSWIFAPFTGRKLLADLRSLDERVEDIENGVATPCLWIFTKDVDFVFVDLGAGLLERETLAEGTVGVELVNELVDHVPRPVILSFQSAHVLVANLRHAHRRHLDVHWTIAVEDEVEEIAVVIVARYLRLDGRLIL